jgi:NitT/TauT family transport system substrate-binding protein
MHAVWTLEGSGIRTPKDLEGKTMASPVGDVHRTLFPAFAAAAGFDEKKVKWIDVDGAALTQTLVAGRADAIPYFLIVGPNVRAAAKAAGKNLHVLKWSDYGIEIYSSGVIVTDDTVAQKADLLRRFMRASWEGLAWSIEHPKEAIDLLLKHNPTMNEAFARENWEITMDHLLTEDAAKNGVGYMTPEKVTKTRDLMTKYAKLAVTVPVEDLYTNAFLPRLFPKRAKE